MMQRTRRLALGDGMILVAALAVACMGMRSIWQGHLAGRGVIAAKQGSYDRLLITALGSACATPLTVACLVVRLRPPRPPWRRVALRPGTVALLVCVVVFGWRGLELTASVLKPDLYSLFGPIDGTAAPIRLTDSSYLVLVASRSASGVLGRVEVFGCHTTLVAAYASPCGPAVLAVWAVLLVSGRWRPEHSGVDRLGRLVGVLWIILAALTIWPV